MSSSVEVSVKLGLDKLRADAAKAAAELQEKFKDQTVKLNLDSGGFLGDLAQHAKGFQDSVSAASQYTQALGQVSQQLDAAGDAINQFTSQAGAAAIAFDSAKAALETLGVDSEAAAAALQSMTGELKGQASGVELVTAGYDVYSSKTETLTKGLTDAEVATTILKASTIGAVGGFSTVAVVADALTSTLNAYGESASKAGEYVDKFAATQNSGKITIDQYAQQMGRLAPTAAQAGIHIDELNGFIATATVKGVSAESTFTGLRAAVGAVLKPSKEAADLAAELGIKFDAAALRTKGLSGILGELHDKGKDTPEILIKLFGGVEAATAILPSAGEGFKTLTQNIDASANSAGTAQKAFDKVAGSMKGQITAATNQASDALVSLGNGATKAMVPLILALTFLVKNFNQLPEPVKEAAGVLIALSGGVLTLGGALAAIAAVTPAVIAGFTALGLATGLAGGATGANTIATIANKLATLANLPATVALTGARTGLTAATVLGTNALVGATAASKGFLVGLLPLLPALAALAAAAGLVALVKLTADLQNGNQALEDVQTQVNASADAMFAAAGRTKAAVEALNAAKKAGTPISAEQLAADKKLIAANNERLKGLQETLAAAQAAEVATGNPASDADEAQVQAKKNLIAQVQSQINALKGQNDKLKAATGATTEGTAAIEDQRTALEKQKDAISEVADKFGEQSKIQETANKLRLAEIQTSVNEGFITEEEGRKQSLQAEKQFLEDQLNLNEGQVAELKALRSSTTDPEALKQLNSQILSAESATADQRLALTKKVAEVRKAIEQEALDAIAKANEAANAAITQSQNARIAAIKEAQIRGQTSAKEAASQIQAIEANSLNQTLARKQSELEQIKVLRDAGTISAETAAQREAALQTEISALNVQRLDAELAKIEEVKQKKLEALAAEREAIQANAELAQGQIGLETDAIASQNALLSAKSNLLQAQSTLTEQRLKFAIEDAEAAGNSGRAEELKVQLAREQIAAKEQQLRIEQEQLALKQQQIALELQSKQITAEIAVQEAAIAVKEAQANGASAEKIAALQRINDLRVQQFQAVGRQISSQERLNALERQALNTQQQATREAAARALVVARRPPASADSGGEGGRSSNSTPANVTPATVTPATVTTSGGDGGGASRSVRGDDTFRSDSGMRFGARTFGADGVPLTGNKSDRVMDDFVRDQNRRGGGFDTRKLQSLSSVSLGGAQPDMRGKGSFSGADVSGKLDQLIAATKDAVGRPNVSIRNVDDAATIGKIYRESGRDNARRAGL